MTNVMRLASLLGVIVLGLVACVAAGGRPIKPGDQVGPFEITTATAEDFASLPFLDFDRYCQREGDQVNCAVSAGTTFNICYIFYGDNVADLDDRWSRAEYQVYIEGRPVDLEAFGVVDFVHPDFGWPMRSWNIVAESIEPAVLKTRHVGLVDGEAFEDLMNVAVESPSAD